MKVEEGGEVKKNNKTGILFIQLMISNSPVISSLNISGSLKWPQGVSSVVITYRIEQLVDEGVF